MRIQPLPTLSASDQRLVDVFTTGTKLSVDELAYTDEFDDLCAKLGATSMPEKRQVYSRLRILRMWGRLPDRHNDF